MFSSVSEGFPSSKMPVQDGHLGVTPGRTVGGWEVRQKGRQPMEGLLPSRLPLWAAGAVLLGISGSQCRTLTSGVSSAMGI